MPEVLIDLAALSVETLRGIARIRRAEPEMLEAVRQAGEQLDDIETAAAVMDAENSSEDSVEAAATTLIAADRHAVVASCDKVSAATYDRLAAANPQSHHLVFALLGHDDATAEMLGRYVNHPWVGCGRLIAKHPNATTEMLVELANSDDDETRAHVTVHRNYPDEGRAAVAEREFDAGTPPQEICELARSNVATVEQLDELAHRSRVLHSDIAANENTGAATLSYMWGATDSRDTSDAIVAHRNCPRELIQQILRYATIAEEADELPRRVRYVLDTIMRREDLDTETVEMCINAPNPLLWSESSKLDLLATHRAAHPDRLREWAGSDRLNMLLAVARNPSTPADVLDELARHASRHVRTAVAGNPNLPAPTLVEIANRKPSSVQRAALFNPRVAAVFGVDTDTWDRLLDENAARTGDAVARAAA